jgi:hypothetical protein
VRFKVWGNYFEKGPKVIKKAEARQGVCPENSSINLYESVLDSKKARTKLFITCKAEQINKLICPAALNR